MEDSQKLERIRALVRDMRLHGERYSPEDVYRTMYDMSLHDISDEFSELTNFMADLKQIVDD